jgi:hypothetical protein
MGLSSAYIILMNLHRVYGLMWHYPILVILFMLFGLISSKNCKNVWLSIFSNLERAWWRLWHKRAMRSKCNIYVHIYYCLDIENEQQLHAMSCDAPGVVFSPTQMFFSIVWNKIETLSVIYGFNLRGKSFGTIFNFLYINIYWKIWFI